MHICKECIGRYKGIPKNFEESSKCDICNNIFEKIDDIIELFKSEVKNIEFNSFLIGSSFPEDIIALDQEIIRDEFPGGSSLKHHLNSLIGKRLESELGKIVDFKNPDIVFRIDTRNLSTELDIKPIYISGRYLKLKRGIPQSPWIHPVKGMALSVAEYIGIPSTKMFKGKDYNFYSSGREDVDVLMLGNGRPFYVEIIKPEKRRADLEYLSEIINENSSGGIKVKDLHLAGIGEVKRMKEENHDKIYEASIILEKIPDKFIETVEGIKDLEIFQRTPERVLRSRKDKIRVKKIYYIEVAEYNPPKARIILKASSGTYIKEFLHGDNGRTVPSLSSILGINIKIEYLNVLEVN